MRHLTRAVSASIALVTTACGGMSSERLDVVVRDSAGVTIVENGDLDLERGLLASPTPLVEIGVIDGPEEMQFFRVSDAKRLADGGIAVANGGSRELKIYNRDGSHRVTVGGSGQGPSEFTYPVGVHVLPGDTILVQDRNDRVFFSATGQFLRRETTDPGDMAALKGRIGGSSEGGQWLADGSFFAPIYQWDQSPPVAGPLSRPPMTFVRVSRDFSSVDTLGTFGGILQQLVDIGETYPSGTVPPFSANTWWGLGPSSGAIVAADNAVPQVEMFFPNGSHVIARWTASPASITRSEVEAWKDRQRSASWAQARLPQLERAWAGMDLPEAKPYYGRANAGSDGRAWLGPIEGEDQGWRAFGPNGHFVGVARLPERFFPMDSGTGWLLGIFRDENEVEFLRLYALVTD